MTTNNPAVQDHDTVREIARTTLRQLCGGPTGRLKAMLGAKDFQIDARDPNTVVSSFKFPNKRGANHCAVTYHHGLDLYSIKLKRVWKKRDKITGIQEYRADVKHAQDGLYGDMLKDYFEQHTGLYLSF